MTALANGAESTIDILLATYNGAAYLDEQLASIEAQTYSNWRLFARDDGSTDRTPEILAAFQARHPEKVTIVRDEDGNVGLVRNFSRLMEVSTAPYAAFCDQDDVWLPEKLSVSLERMRELEAEHGADKPLLVFTDLTVVDEGLKVIHPSFWRYQSLKPERCNELNRLLLQNVVTGCTTLMSRSLVEKAVPIPKSAVVHDWWVALVSAGFGRAASVPRSTVLYRQHAKNLIGARANTWFSLPDRAYRTLINYKYERRKLLTYFIQAKALHGRFSAGLPDEQRRALSLFLGIWDANLARRLACALRAKCLPTSPLHSLKILLMS